jgi:hypothetical protein
VPSATYNLIRQAMLQRAPISGVYKGCIRRMCPHTLGTKRGREKVLCYQFGGESRSGLAPDGSPGNWRDIFVDELEDVRLQPGDWHTGPAPEHPQLAVDEIDLEVPAWWVWPTPTRRRLRDS